MVISGRPRAIVVGAGAAGLTMAHVLAGAGLSVEVLEKEMRLAMPWRARHPRLHLNTHRDLSSLEGVAYPPKTQAFPHKSLVIEHLEKFRRHHAIPVEFGVDVGRVDRGKDVWRVATSNGVREAEHVVVATGRDREPFVPTWQGAEGFTGAIIHSAEFGDASDYAGRRVLVVGAGNSGFDLLNHLVRVPTAAIWLSVRSGPTILPKRIGKIAIHRFSPIFAALPVPLLDASLALTQRLIFGDLTRFGMPKAAVGGGTRLIRQNIAIATDDGAVAAIRAGRILVTGGIEAFDGSRVVLQDGVHIEPEIVIAATGYRTGLEPMLGHLGVLDERGLPLFQGADHDRRFPGLWFAAMRPSIIGCLANARRQARALVAALQAMAPPQV